MSLGRGFPPFEDKSVTGASDRLATAFRIGVAEVGPNLVGDGSDAFLSSPSVGADGAGPIRGRRISRWLPEKVSGEVAADAAFCCSGGLSPHHKNEIMDK